MCLCVSESVRVGAEGDGGVVGLGNTSTPCECCAVGDTVRGGR